MHAGTRALPSAKRCTTLFDGAGLRAGGQHQRGLELLACIWLSSSQPARELRIARAGAGGVDQHEAGSSPARRAARATRRRLSTLCAVTPSMRPSMCICSCAPMRTASAETSATRRGPWRSTQRTASFVSVVVLPAPVGPIARRCRPPRASDRRSRAPPAKSWRWRAGAPASARCARAAAPRRALQARR